MGYDFYFAQILDCGTCDLSMLDDMEMDVSDIIDELKESGDLSLSSIFSRAFADALEHFTDAVHEKVPDLQAQLEAYIAFDDDGEKDLPDELADIAEKGGYAERADEDCTCSELAQDDLDALLSLTPESDFELYFNYLDTAISCMADNEVYSRFFADELEEFGNALGLCVGGC